MPSIAPQDPILRLDALSKAFGPVTVLRGVNLDLYAGEVHAVLGENGAGKSTLINLITGKYAPTSGTVSLAEGHQVRGPRDAKLHGIRLVPQDTVCVPEFSVGRNVLLGSERRLMHRDRLTRGERALASAALERVGAEFTVDQRAGNLTVPQMRLMQIAKALAQPGEILVLDEPTAALSSRDSEHMLERVEMLRDSGAAIVYVTHRLAEVMRLADRVSVLRDGVKVAEYDRANLSHEQLIRDMTRGRMSVAAPDVERQALGVPVLEVRSVHSPGIVHDVSFEAAEGQIVGIAGVQGSGQGALLSVLAGREALAAGSVTLAGVSIRPGSPRAARRAGLALVPADRRVAGVVTCMSLTDNIAQSSGQGILGARRRRREKSSALRHLARFNTKYADVNQPASSLSGGNQQKVALARAMTTAPKVLLVDEPTQGVDINAKQDVREHLVRLAREGRCAVVIATSEFQDLVGLADEIHVMRRGELIATLDASASYEEILRHAVT